MISSNRFEKHKIYNINLINPDWEVVDLIKKVNINRLDGV